MEETDDTKSGGETPSLEAVAVGVLRHPELLQEIFRRLAWLEKEQLVALRRAIDQALQHREDVLSACANGSFGRDFVVKPALESLVDGDEPPLETPDPV